MVTAKVAAWLMTTSVPDVMDRIVPTSGPARAWPIPPAPGTITVRPTSADVHAAPVAEIVVLPIVVCMLAMVRWTVLTAVFSSMLQFEPGISVTEHPVISRVVPLFMISGALMRYAVPGTPRAIFPPAVARSAFRVAVSLVPLPAPSIAHP